MFDLVTVGHLTIDRIFLPQTSTSEPVLGGPPTYVSLAARKLEANVSVISKVGGDFPHEYIKWLKSNGVDLSGLKRIKDASTTKFLLKYGKEERQLQLKSLAPPISPEDVSGSLRSKAVHAAPIANELSQNVIDKLRASTDTLSLDPQGFVRRFDEQGNMKLGKWEGTRILRQIDVCKSSFSEIRAATGLTSLQLAVQKIHSCGPRIVIVTRGTKGSTLFADGKLYEIPVCKPRVVRDFTGAGDAFIGAFLAEYVHGKEPAWCACVGSAASSFVVEGVGPTVFGEKKETYKRATEIYEKGLKRLTV
jgi:sugar/nucleoside kinase (ribokinase family)